MASAFRDRMLAATRVAYDQQRALQEEISQLYVQCAENLGRVADRYGDDSLTGRQAIVLRKSMQRYTRQMWSKVESKTRAAAYASAGIGIEAQASMLDDALHGIGITGKPSFMSVFGRTKDEAVASVLNGHIYAGKRAGLSKRIWNNEAILNGQLESIISTAVAEGRSATQLARDLEAYVNPEAMMPDHWNDIYPMPFSYAVDYNAKRLAVTTLNHAYYQGTIMAARENPFAEFLHWELSSFHLIYDVCDTYMEHDEGLGLGNFSLDNAPLPHPFCRCTWYIDSSKSLDEIGQELGDWLAGAENLKLEKAFGEWRDAQDSLTWDSYQILRPYAGLLSDQPDEEMIRNVQSVIDRVTADFPELGMHLESVEFVPEHGIGATRNDGKVIHLDNSVFKNMETLRKEFNKSVQDGNTVYAENPLFIVAHECGHALENLAIQKRFGIHIKSYEARAEFEQRKKEIGISYFLHAGFTDETKEEIYDIIKMQLGKRALDSPSEMMAQAVANYYYGTERHALSEHLLQYLTQLLRE